jgi:hypothetical protein
VAEKEIIFPSSVIGLIKLLVVAEAAAEVEFLVIVEKVSPMTMTSIQRRL